MERSSMSISYTVFTKPWKTKTLAELARFVSDLGFDGVELPVRPGYQVEPENISKSLPEAARIFADHGVRIGTLAGPTDEVTIAACAEAGVPIIRICEGIDRDIGYLATERRLKERYDALLPALEQHGVAIGVQNHCDFCVNNAMGILHLIEGYEPKHLCAVLDQAHNGLNGEPPELAIDILWSHLRVVNLKSAFWVRTNGPDAPEATWKSHWTSGRHGLAYWSRTVDELKKRDYAGDICLTAEYSDEERVDALIAEDVQYARQLFDRAGP
jgi:sugar phosphate isomerase/epimerase